MNPSVHAWDAWETYTSFPYFGGGSTSTRDRLFGVGGAFDVGVAVQASPVSTAGFYSRVTTTFLGRTTDGWRDYRAFVLEAGFRYTHFGRSGGPVYVRFEVGPSFAFSMFATTALNVAVSGALGYRLVDSKSFTFGLAARVGFVAGFGFGDGDMGSYEWGQTLATGGIEVQAVHRWPKRRRPR